MEITIQHFNDCPNWLEAAEHVQRAVEHVDTDVIVRLEIVNTPKKPKKYGFEARQQS
jgi:hypothetical protein